MEQILKDITNPFDIKGFVNLLNMLVNSSTGRDFYSKIVTYYQDRAMDGNGGYAKKIPDEFITSDYMGHWEKIEYFSNFFPTEHRIYINSSLESTRQLVEMFINECINQNIAFELKYATEAHDRSDGIVIGSNTRAYKKHIDILRKIAKENPQFIFECGTPHILTSKLDGWMGLADENISNRYQSYSESRIGLILSACTQYLLNHPELENRVQGYENMQKSYMNRYRCIERITNRGIEKGELATSQKSQSIKTNITKELANILNESQYRVNYVDLCKVINEDPNKVIREIYQIFLENCEILGINPNMPTQYDISQRDLLQVEEEKSAEKRVDLENKNYIDLINEYLANSDGELTMQETITVLRALDERMLSEVQLIGASLTDAFLLTKDTKDITYLKKSYDSVLSHCYIGDEELGGKLVKICGFYLKNGKNSQNEKGIYSEILSSRMGLDSNRLEAIKEKNCMYFSQPLEPIENMQKSLDILQVMLEKHNRTSPQLKNSNLEAKIKFLEFMVEHYNEVTEYFLEISTKLELMSKEEIEGKAKKFYLEERPTAVQFERSVNKRRIAEGVASGIEVKMDEKALEYEWFADL